MEEKRGLGGKFGFKGVRQNYWKGNMGSRQGYFLFISEKEIEINTIDLTVGNIFGLFSFPEFCLPNQDPYV